MRAYFPLAVFVASLTFSACGILGDDEGSGSNSVTLGDQTYQLGASDVKGKKEGRIAFQLDFTLPEGTLTITASAQAGGGGQLLPFFNTGFARYAPATGEPYTLHGAQSADGSISIDGLDEGRGFGAFTLELARLSGETILISGTFAGVSLVEEPVTEKGNTLDCKVRAFSVQGTEPLRGGRFTNNASREVITVGAELSPSVGVTLFMPRTIEPGFYEIDNVTYRGTARDNDYAGFGTSGSITIESHDQARRHITGGFAFSGHAQNPSAAKVPLLVNNGSFSVYYFAD